jgi:hypothetical protein
MRLSINGVETADYTETDATIPQEGVIGLQIHGKMVGTIRYRIIRIDEFPPLLASDFRLAPAAEGWEPSKAPVPFEGDTIRQAGDPDEHGIRIRQGQLMSKSFPIETSPSTGSGSSPRRRRSRSVRRCFSIKKARRSWPMTTAASTPPPTGGPTLSASAAMPAPARRGSGSRPTPGRYR